MRISEQVDKLLDEVQAILLSILVKLGPFFVAMMPALFTAYAIYYTYQQDAGHDLALFFAVVVGLAMETVGIIATHTAIDLYNGKESGAVQAGKFWLMLLLVPVYVVGVAGTVYYSENAFTPLVKSLGVASPFLTCIVYIAVALARDLSRVSQHQERQSQQGRADKQEGKQYKRQLELRKLELEQERLLKEQELSAQVQIEQARVLAQSQHESQHKQPGAEREPAQASIVICPDCGRDDFDTVQGLNAHKRFCPAQKEKVNGNGNH